MPKERPNPKNANLKQTTRTKIQIFKRLTHVILKIGSLQFWDLFGIANLLFEDFDAGFMELKENQGVLENCPLLSRVTIRGLMGGSPVVDLVASTVIR